MEKYGVQTDTKTERCPICNATTIRHGEVCRCPACGTKPYEVVKKETDDEEGKK